MIPQISGAAINQIKVVPYPSLTYRVADEQITGTIDGLDAIRQAAYHILSTERYDYEIHGSNYGVELRKCKGRGFDYLETTIQKTLRNALLQDDRITNVTVTNVQKVKADAALIEAEITSSRGTFRMGVNVEL